MDNPQILSPKPSIDEALEFFGMSNMDKAMGIQALLRIIEFDKLPLYINEHLTCVPTSIKYGDQYDSEDEFVECLLIDPKDEREFSSEIILDSFHLHISSDNIFYFLVDRVKHEGVSYYISLPDRTILEYKTIGYEKSYFDRKQLIEFKAKYPALFSESQNVKDSPSKKAGIQEQRIAAFKYWLVGNSGKSIHDREDLQSCYQKLGEPTKDKVWEKLQQMDSRLFVVGKDDFKKDMADIVRFTQGTGKGRNR